MTTIPDGPTWRIIDEAIRGFLFERRVPLDTADEWTTELVTIVAEHLAPVPVRSAHKMFVFEKAGDPWVELVADEYPLQRMHLRMLPDEAVGMGRALVEAAEACMDGDR